MKFFNVILSCTLIAGILHGKDVIDEQTGYVVKFGLSYTDQNVDASEESPCTEFIPDELGLSALFPKSIEYGYGMGYFYHLGREYLPLYIVKNPKYIVIASPEINLSKQSFSEFTLITDVETGSNPGDRFAISLQEADVDGHVFKISFGVAVTELFITSLNSYSHLGSNDTLPLGEQSRSHTGSDIKQINIHWEKWDRYWIYSKGWVLKPCNRQLEPLGDISGVQWTLQVEGERARFVQEDGSLTNSVIVIAKENRIILLEPGQDTFRVSYIDKSVENFENSYPVYSITIGFEEDGFVVGTQSRGRATLID